MLWCLGTGRCGTLSLSHQLGGVHEPSPGIGHDCNLHAVLKEHLARGKPSVDRLYSLVINDIRAIDKDAEFIWLLRDPFSCVRSMIDTKHLDVLDSKYYPIPKEPDKAKAAAWVWSNINSRIYQDLRHHSHWSLLPTEQLSVHLGITHRWSYNDLNDKQHADVMKICGDLWIALWNEFPQLQAVA